MTSFTYLGLILLAIIIFWTFASWWAVHNIEQPTYEVVANMNGYEIRSYDSYIVAEATVEAGSEREGLTEGFKIVADYIFGNNTTEEKVSMTSPVLSGSEGVGNSQKIDMTSPVLATGDGDSRTIAFVMPSKYTLESLPKPNDERVQLRTVPAQTVAVKKFSWYATNSRISAKKEELLRDLGEDNVKITGFPYYAGYNPPLTIPFMQQHEIQVAIDFN